MSQQRMNKEFIRLQNLIIPEFFRTVENFTMIKAPREIPVTIEVKDAFRKMLSFRTAWDSILYGYALETRAIAEFRARYGYESIASLAVTLEDWDDVFCLTAEYGSVIKKENSFYVPQEDVLFLLENCRRIPAQRIPN